MPKRDRSAYILVLPSLFTTGNLFCGFYSILRSFLNDFERASYAILLAGIFDILDGRVARVTGSTSKFGVEYDSIADVVSFGLAPAILAYVWALQPFARLGWAGAFFFCSMWCSETREIQCHRRRYAKELFCGPPNSGCRKPRSRHRDCLPRPAISTPRAPDACPGFYPWTSDG